MAAHAFTSVSSQLRTWSRPADAGDDGFLLDEFLATRDESSFAEILRRHGPMVLGVLGDVFQPTFLVLIRRSESIRRRASLAAWLHGRGFAARSASQPQCRSSTRDR